VSSCSTPHISFFLPLLAEGTPVRDNQQYPLGSIAPAYPAPLGGLSELIAAAQAETKQIADEEELPPGYVVAASSSCITSIGIPTRAAFADTPAFDLIVVDEVHRTGVPRTTLMAAIHANGDEHRSAALATVLDFCASRPSRASLTDGRVFREEQR